MVTKSLGGKLIKIRAFSQRDLRNVKKFQNFINSLISEDAKILLNSKKSKKEERAWLKDKIKNVARKKEVALTAEHNRKVIANTGIDLDLFRKSHIGNFGISIREGYRGIGLGKYLMAEIIKLAKKELKPRPKIIRLSVFSNNKPAISLYRKMGFRKVAVIPKQYQYKGRFVDEIIMLLDL